MANAYTLISQEFPNTYVQFSPDDGTTVSDPPAGTQTLQLTESNKPFKIFFYGQVAGSFRTTGFGYQNISGSPQTYSFTWLNSGGGNTSKYYYVIASSIAVAGRNFISTINYIDTSGLNTNGLRLQAGQLGWVNFTVSTPLQVTVEPNYFITIIGSTNNNSIDTFGSLPDVNGTCFSGSALVLMGDLTYKKISDIVRGDIVMNDIDKMETSIVSKVSTTGGILRDAVKIPIGLLGNKEDLICTYHPIFVKNGTERRFSRDIDGVELIKSFETFYNLQFDYESTFYIERIKVDSVSPYFPGDFLPDELFINKDNNLRIVVDNENDPRRNKPLLTEDKISPELVDLLDISKLSLI